MKTSPDMHISRLRIVTDRPLAAGREQELGRQFAGALQHALSGTRHDLRIGEVVIRAPGNHLDDRAAMTGLASTVARRILEHSQD